MKHFSTQRELAKDKYAVGVKKSIVGHLPLGRTGIFAKNDILFFDRRQHM